MTKDKLKELLSDKLSKEYELYLDELKNKPVDEIIKCSFQTAAKEEIVMCMNDCYFLSEKQLKALYDSSNSLNEIYDDYMCANYSNVEDISNSAIYASNKLIGRDKMLSQAR